jgi:hypothetical protein
MFSSSGHKSISRDREIGVLSALALLMLAPLLLIALLIKLDFSGPVVFAQERVGAKRVCETEENWLLSSLDELPQLQCPETRDEP